MRKELGCTAETTSNDGTSSNEPQGSLSYLQSALHYAECGLFVFPCDSQKSPYIKHGFKNASRNPEDIVRWWKQHRNASIGCACEASGIVVIDLDQKNGKEGISEISKICKNHGIDPTGAFRVVTPTGGQHYIFLYDYSSGPLKGGTDLLARGVDVKASGGYVILPPSKVNSGYYKMDGNTWSGTPAFLPERLRDLIKQTAARRPVVGCKAKGESANKALSREVKRVASTPEGNRNDQLNKSAYYLGRFVYADSLAREEVEDSLCEAAIKSGLEIDESQSTIQSGLNAGIAAAENESPSETPSMYAHTDMGNAQLLVDMFSEQIRYCTSWGRWLSFDGRRWKAASDESVMILAKKVALELRDRARSDDTDTLEKWAKTTQSRARLEAMVSLAKSDERIIAEPEEFDIDNYLLNCSNGVLDLQTGELLPHSPKRMLMKVADVAFDPDADCPIWKKFLEKITGGNSETASYLQRAIGYSLSGLTSEQCLFYLYGRGTNGKSTLVETISKMLGNYSLKTKSDVIYEKKSDGNASNDVARLFGARFVSCSEMTSHGLNEGLIKDLTGGDRVTARFLFKEYFEFYPVLKLWMYGNDKPNIRGTDEGIWRRIKLIPFFVQILEEEKDPKLGERLEAERSGILRWAYEGFKEWMRSGLGTAPQVEAATQSHREDMDLIQQFIDERCVCREDQSILSQTLYEVYCHWASEAKYRPLSPQQFAEAIEKKGFCKKLAPRTRKSIRVGLCLRENDPNLPSIVENFTPMVSLTGPESI